MAKEYQKSNEELVSEIRQGRNVPENLNQLYLQNQVMLRRTAESFKWSKEPLEDLMQSGWIGMQTAVDKYDPDSGFKFLTYSLFWVRNAIQRSIENSGHLVRLPANRQEQVYQYQKFVMQYRELHNGDDPEPDTICRALEISGEVLERIKKALRIQSLDSLERPLPGVENLTLSDTIQDDFSVSDEVTDKVLAEDIKAEIWSILDALKPDHRTALIETVMKCRTLAEVGQELGVGYQRVAQLRNEAIRNIRRMRAFKRLEKDYADLYGLALRGSGLGTFRITRTSSTEAAALRLIEDEEKLKEQLCYLRDFSALKTWIIKYQLSRADRPTAEAVIRELVSAPELQTILIRVIVKGEKVNALKNPELMKYRQAVSVLHRKLEKLCSEMPVDGTEEADG